MHMSGWCFMIHAFPWKCFAKLVNLLLHMSSACFVSHAFHQKPIAKSVNPFLNSKIFRSNCILHGRSVDLVSFTNYCKWIKQSEILCCKIWLHKMHQKADECFNELLSARRHLFVSSHGWWAQLLFELARCVMMVTVLLSFMNVRWGDLSFSVC